MLVVLGQEGAVPGLCLELLACLPASGWMCTVTAAASHAPPTGCALLSQRPVVCRYQAGSKDDDAQDVVNAALALVDTRNTAGHSAQAGAHDQHAGGASRGGNGAETPAQQLVLWVCLLAAVGLLTHALLRYIRTGTTRQVRARPAVVCRVLCFAVASSRSALRVPKLAADWVLLVPWHAGFHAHAAGCRTIRCPSASWRCCCRW